MNDNRQRATGPALAGVALGAALLGHPPAAAGQTFDLELEASEDRWNYPFNLTPGMRQFASTFGAINETGFDDYDAQFIVGFDTSGEVPTGEGADRYRVVAARLHVWITEGERFRFDPTYDSFTTYLPGGDPEAEPDADPGRPIAAFGTGYRGSDPNTGDSWSVGTWFEGAPFGGTPDVDPAQGSRFAFVSALDGAGEAIDVSNRLKDRIDPAPMAIGQVPGVTPGEFVPADSEVVFDLSPCRGGGALLLREGLDAGVVRLSLASLQAASGGPGGPDGDPNFPEYYTRDNPLAPALGYVPTLELEVKIGNPADLTGPNMDGVPDGELTSSDFLFYLDLFAAGDAGADLTGDVRPGIPDCAITSRDFLYFLDQFAAS